MNQILVTEKLQITPELKRKKKIYKFYFILSVFIVSDLVIEKNNRKDDNKIGIKISQAEGQKCERCWMYSTTVGEDKENPTICHRCSEALK